MSNQDSLFELCYIIFNACIEKWDISNKSMSNLINTFNLATLVEQHQEYFNSMGVQGVVEEMEDYIQKRGGSICE